MEKLQQFSKIILFSQWKVKIPLPAVTLKVHSHSLLFKTWILKIEIVKVDKQKVINVASSSLNFIFYNPSTSPSITVGFANFICQLYLSTWLSVTPPSSSSPFTAFFSRMIGAAINAAPSAVAINDPTRFNMHTFL